MQARTIECADCKAILDPYDCLNELMTESDYTYAEQELKRMKLELEELSRERARLRAAIARAKKPR